tara:strand:- start:27469 stop:27609 length:141 start_codon:yes stop_codon:yes gene_type:complete
MTHAEQVVLSGLMQIKKSMEEQKKESTESTESYYESLKKDYCVFSI